MKKPLKIVGAVLGGIVAIGIVAAIAGAGGHSKTAAATTPPAQVSTPAPDPAPVVVTETVVRTVPAPAARVSAPKPKPRPAPVVISDKNWTVVPGSLLTSADFGGDWKGTVRITNDNYDAQSASFTFTIMRAGQQIGTMSGNVSQVSPGQTVTVELISFDSYSPGAFRYYFQTDYSF